MACKNLSMVGEHRDVHDLQRCSNDHRDSSTYCAPDRKNAEKGRNEVLLSMLHLLPHNSKTWWWPAFKPADKSFRYEEIALRPRSASTPRVHVLTASIVASIAFRRSPIGNVGRGGDSTPSSRCKPFVQMQTNDNLFTRYLDASLQIFRLRLSIFFVLLFFSFRKARNSTFREEDRNEIGR